MEKFVHPSAFVRTYDYTIVVPCSNQGQGVVQLLTDLEGILTPLNHKILVVVVDDASSDDTNCILQNFSFANSRINFHLLSLPAHQGRQSAILEGLSIARRHSCEHFIVMEGDGSDDPRAIPKLMDTSGKDVVFVDKGPKADNPFFWIIYRFHQFFFWLLTSKEIDFDHYSLINKKAVDALLRDPFLHYTTALHNRGLEISKLRMESPMRKFGQEYRALFRHSTLAFLEFGEDLLNIFLKFSLSLGFLFFGGLFSAIYCVYFAGLELPTWSIFALVGLFNGFILSIGFFAISVIILNQKKQYLRSNRIINTSANRQSHQHQLIQTVKDPIRLN